jgi:hypothetical protein
MLFLTEDARLVCTHEPGRVDTVGTQDLVTVERRKVLVDSDPEQRPISGCPNIGPGLTPCTTTLDVRVGYSGFLRILGKRICLITVTGFTNGSPPGGARYEVRQAGQSFVSERS